MNLRILIFLFLSGTMNIHAQWREDFSQVPFFSHAPWKGDFTHWTQDQGWLRSQGPAVSGTCITLERAISPDTGFELRFLAHLMFATSSNNYLEVELEDSVRRTSIVVLLGGTPDEVSVFIRKKGNDSLVIDGVDKRLSSSSSNLMAVRLRSLNGVLALELGLQGDTSAWIVEGTGTGPELFPDRLRIRACYTASNASKFLLDAIYIGKPDYDTLAPIISSIYDQDSTHWQIEFSEGMDTSSGRLTDDLGVSLPFLWTSETTLTCRIDSGIRMPLLAEGFKDRVGNRIPDTVLNLRYEPYGFREIQITELSADPSPPQGLPEVEWIELFNAGSQQRQLKEFLLADLSSTHLFPACTLKPHERLILTSKGNCILFETFGSCLELGFSASFLNNSGDRLLLLNRQGDTLEWLEYSDQWHSDPVKRTGGYTLEKRDPLNKCLSDKENFVTSEAVLGGTPGQLNSVDERIHDSIAPFLISMDVIGPLRLDMLFNEALEGKGAGFLFHQDTLPLTSLGSGQYRIDFPFPLQDNAGIVYEGKLIDLEDCAGNKSIVTVSFRYAIPVIPDPHELVFTEIFFRPDAGQAAFVEVFNRGEKAQSLAGTALFLGDKELRLSNRLLYPGEALILCRAVDSPLFSGLPYLVLTGMPVLSPQSGHMSVKNVRNELLDAVCYADTQLLAWPRKAGGYSLQRIDSTRNCSYPHDWQASETFGGSPGVHAFGYVHGKEIIPQIQLIYPESRSSFRVRFSGPLGEKPVDIRIDDAWGSPLRWELVSNDYRTWLLEWSDSLMFSTSYRLGLSGLEGCNGEKLPEQDLEFRLPGTPEALIINEILFDPTGDEPDYVELYNAGMEAVDLRGMKLGNLNIDGSLNDDYPISGNGYLLMPGAYVVLTEPHHRLPKRYDNYDEARVVLMPKLPSFPNAEGAVIVLDSLGNPLDSFRYTDKFHSPILTENEGVSLERINPDLRGDQGGNWTSASATVHFGTPGSRNSQFREQPTDQKKHWNLYTPSFSPDGDGFEDLALLVYSGLEPGGTVNINLYSLSGLPVYEWANNLPCGSSGTLKWEGHDAEGLEMPDGPYCVLIVWTNKAGISKRERLILVKASRLSD